MDFSKIKLVIWDLDETLWKGTLSEGNVIVPEKHISLLKDMVDAGVVCSICSKNDENQINEKLSELNIAEYFVFNSINWSPKGDRVRQIISEMNLRQPNVLFIDDNASNRGEVKHCCPEILGVEDVDIIADLCGYFSQVKKADINHSRLAQYKVLQKKRDFKADCSSNEEFLKISNIKVEIKTDCENHIDRIVDLVLRSNQLNFTKIRSQKEEIIELLNNRKVKCGYVSAKDRFGDYGIVGFYAEENGSLLHFVFSCRTLGMGIEQYVYYQLNCPHINVVEPVSSNLLGPKPNWINNDENIGILNAQATVSKKLVIKGPCDMSQMFAYIKQNQNVITEFVYVNDNGVSIEQGTTTTHIVDHLLLDGATKDYLASSLPFGDQHMFDTAMFDKDVAYVVLSTFADPNLGIYENKENGAKIAFGEFCNDLTDETIWDELISGKLFVANCKFTKESLSAFKNEYKYIGRIKPEEIVKNIDIIYQHIAPSARIILVLGSEMPFESNQQKAYEDRHIYNAILNSKLKKWSEGKDRVYFLDFNKHIKDQTAFTNNINHFNRSIYYQISNDLIEIISNDDSISIRKRSKLSAYLKNLFERVINKISHKRKKHDK